MGLIGHRGDIAHVDTGERHGAALVDIAQGHRDQLARRGEDDGGVDLDGEPRAGAAGPLGAQLEGEPLVGLVPRHHVDHTPPVPRHLKRDVRR